MDDRSPSLRHPKSWLVSFLQLYSHASHFTKIVKGISFYGANWGVVIVAKITTTIRRSIAKRLPFPVKEKAILLTWKYIM